MIYIKKKLDFIIKEDPGNFNEWIGNIHMTDDDSMFTFARISGDCKQHKTKHDTQSVGKVYLGDAR